MEAELPKADLPKCNRHRFQFRLRTLTILVTLFSVAYWVVADRQRLIRERDEALRAQGILTQMSADSRAAAEGAIEQAKRQSQRADAEVEVYQRQIEQLKAELREKK
jgi:hypothetical protein